MRHYFSELNWDEEITEQMNVDETWIVIRDEIAHVRETYILIIKSNNNKIFKRQFNNDDSLFIT